MEYSLLLFFQPLKVNRISENITPSVGLLQFEDGGLLSSYNVKGQTLFNIIYRHYYKILI